MKVRVPRYSNAEYFSLMKGKLNNWWGWIIKQKTLPPDNEDIISYAGGCYRIYFKVYCNMNHYEYWNNVHRKHWHCGIIYSESEAGTELQDSDVFKVLLQGTKNNIDYLCGSSTWWGEPCQGGEYKEYTLPPFPYLASRNPQTLNNEEIFEKYDVDKKWFRDFWNSLVPPSQQVNPDEAAPIEPDGERFAFFYALLTEQKEPIILDASGYCHPYGAQGISDCEEASSCYNILTGEGVGWCTLDTRFDHNDPSFSIPIRFEKNGVQMDKYPPETNIYYYDVNMM